MNMAIAMMDRSMAGRKPLKLRCVETGEVATQTEWAESFARELGTNPRGVQQSLARARRLNERWHGLTFEVVS